MKNYSQFMEETKFKNCPPGKYYCFTDKKCKPIPKGYYVGAKGRLAHEPEDGDNDNGNGSDNGVDNSNGSSNSGSSGNGQGSNGGGS